MQTRQTLRFTANELKFTVIHLFILKSPLFVFPLQT